VKARVEGLWQVTPDATMAVGAVESRGPYPRFTGDTSSYSGSAPTEGGEVTWSGAGGAETIDCADPMVLCPVEVLGLVDGLLVLDQPTGRASLELALGGLDAGGLPSEVVEETSSANDMIEGRRCALHQDASPYDGAVYYRTTLTLCFDDTDGNGVRDVMEGFASVVIAPPGEPDPAADEGPGRELALRFDGIRHPDD